MRIKIKVRWLFYTHLAGGKKHSRSSSSCAECARGTVPIPLAPVESTAHDITALNTPVDFPPLRRHPETERAVWGGDIADSVGVSQWCVSRKQNLVEKLISWFYRTLCISVALGKTAEWYLCSRNSVRERGRRERKTFCAKVKKSRFAVNASV